MRFLADQDVYAVTINLLMGLGHDVVTAESLGMAQADDEKLLRVVHEQERIFVTRDRDFGGIVFVQCGGPRRHLPPHPSVHAKCRACRTAASSEFAQ